MQDLTHPFPPSRPEIWPDYLTKVVRCGDDGFVLGSDTPLVRPTGPGRFALGKDGGRCLALLSVLCRRPVDADMLRPLEAAAIHWASGDKALANLRLVFSGLPKLDAPADAARLQAAAYCLDNGMAPRDLMKALDLDPSVLDLAKFDPDQPRVPAGNGEESGRWTNDGTISSGRSVDVTLAATTSNFGYACKVLGLDPHAASDALHAAKSAARIGGADNCVFDLETGDIFFNGEHIGNLENRCGETVRLSNRYELAALE